MSAFVGTSQPRYTVSMPEVFHEAMNSTAPSTTTATTMHIRRHRSTRDEAGKRRPQGQPGSPPVQFSPSHRGFRPSPPTVSPFIDSVNASSEHAFAAKDERPKRPFRPPLGSYSLRSEHERRSGAGRSTSHANGTETVHPYATGRTISPALQQQPLNPQNLRNTKSLGDGLRNLRHRLSSQGKDVSSNGRETPDSVVSAPNLAVEEARTSFKSTMTTDSSLNNTSTLNTDRSSLLTGESSQSDFVQVYPHWPDTSEDRPSMSMEDDIIGMYEDGFGSVRGSSIDARSKRSFQEVRPSSSSTQQGKRPNMLHRRSQSASVLEQFKTTDTGLLPPKPLSSHVHRSSTDIISGRMSSPAPIGRRPERPPSTQTPARDRYGFKKKSQYITDQQYDAWNAQYDVYLDRRRKKWRALMKSYGLLQEKPIRFPPKSDKIKRYVRKGVPPEWRGAAWWWYAGGPGKLRENAGLYNNLLEKIEQGELSDSDRDLIERDLNRTFPDNIRFKPDPTTTLDAQSGAGGGSDKHRQSREPETPILKSLRHVLQAFAIHNPSIGYCQSLNFLAGLLLLFLDGDEEKAFILLNVITTTHLPGTHGVALEGANIDIAVLMACVKDCLPAIWAKLDDKGGGLALTPSAQALRLPTVSLATTAWFMSLFVGTLPIESVLRVWDCLFFEGSKTLFRIALAIFKYGQTPILAVHDPMEIFQVVQTIPRSMLDVNGLMRVCFKRRGGFGHISQDLIERRREERRRDVKEGVVKMERKGVLGGKLSWRSRTMR